MPRKYFRKYLPTHKSILDNRWIAWCGPWIKHHNLWHLHRRSVAGGVAVGLFGGLIPGPLQILTSVGLSILFRVNLPVAALVTFYTNPLTIVPLYYLAYRLGSLVTFHDAADQPLTTFSMSGHTLTSWIPALIDWMVSLGKPLAVGLPLLALLLAAIGYFVVDGAWRLQVQWAWRHRNRQRKKGK